MSRWIAPGVAVGIWAALALALVWPGGLSSVAPRGGKGFGKPPHGGPRGKLRDKLRERLDERQGEPDVDG